MRFCCPHCGDERPIPTLKINSGYPLDCDHCGRRAPAGSWIRIDDDGLSDAYTEYDYYGIRPMRIYSSRILEDNNRVYKKLENDLLTLARVNLWTDHELRPETDAWIGSNFFLHVITKGSARHEGQKKQLIAAYAYQATIKYPFVIPVVADDTSYSHFFFESPVIDLYSDYDAGLNELFRALGFGYGEKLATFDLANFERSSEPFQVCGFLDTQLVSAILKNPKIIRGLSSRSFEKFIAELFDGFGYEVELTKRTRDGGRDIVAVRKREVDIRILIECKHPGQGVIIGARPVRELLGVRTDDAATKAILATSAYFSKEARLIFERNHWTLEGRDYDGLLEWLQLYNKSKKS